jgi:hypothetical protein
MNEANLFDSWFVYVSESEECLLEDVLITPVSYTVLFHSFRFLTCFSGPFSCQTGQ